MKKITRFIAPLFVIILFVLIFGRWLTSGVLSGGDWPFLYPQAVAEVVPFSTWDTLFNNGVGMSAMSKIWFDVYALTIVKLANILTWPIFERVVWYFPYVLLSFFSSYLLSKRFIADKNFNLLSGVIYTANTYSLLIVSGGQAGVFMAYAFLPLTFCSLLSLLDKFSLRRSLIFALALSILILLDLRVAYMFLAAFGLLSLIYLIYNHKDLVSKIVYLGVVPSVVALMLHFFWILPIILMGRNPASELTEIFTSSASLSFFSFAKLENAIGLLHPNWPENFFGKVAFLKPEFLIVGVLAFASLIFIPAENKHKKVSLLSFVLLGILGTFLAKGVNDPFGVLYEFFFNTVPGFVMFRDPTKWYMLIAVSFSVLIPYALLKVSEYKQIKKFVILVPVLFIIFWGILIRDSFNGVLKGTLIPRQIPANYQKLADTLASDKTFYRTLWVPIYPSLAYVSNTHPAIPAVEFFQATSPANLIKKLQDPATERILQEVGVRYVILPEDIYGKIFLSDRKYDEKEYQKVKEGLSRVPYLVSRDGFGKIGVFVIENSKDHFWVNNPLATTDYKYMSPTKFEGRVNGAKKGDKLIFSESYDGLWRLKINNNEVIDSKPYEVGNQTLNSFVLDKDVDSRSYVVEYRPQNWLYIGMLVSGISLGIVVLILLKQNK